MPSPSGTGSPTRRGLLEAALGLNTAALAGCLFGREPRTEDTDRPSGTGSTSPPKPNQSPTRTPSSVPDDRHDFWVSNRTGTGYPVDLRVSRTGTTDAVLDGCYEAPAGLALRFPDVGEEGVTYDVTATLVGGDGLEDQWLPGSCPEEYTGLFGTDGGVIIDDGLSFTQNECDYATVGHEVPEIDPDDVESCPEPTSSQSVTTISPSRTSTG